MHISFSVIITLLLFTGCQPRDSSTESKDKEKDNHQVSIVVHGGAGNIQRSAMDSTTKLQYKQKLKQALETGYKTLKQGETAVEAVERTIRVFEKDSFFNAGRGSVLNENGHVRMDAALMRGKDKQAGAVADLSGIKHPITGARMVMDSSDHVMLVSKGAKAFSEKNGLSLADSAYLVTQDRHHSYLRKQHKADKDLEGVARQKWGTVGAVALDGSGNLAAGTSTGGLTLKGKGRVGDSPTIGAGTYADNATCAVSATGQGEFFMRNLIAYDVAARIQYQQNGLKKAVDSLIHQKLTQAGGKGGLIALDTAGNIAMAFNTSGMFRAYKQKGEDANALIFPK